MSSVEDRRRGARWTRSAVTLLTFGVLSAVVWRKAEAFAENGGKGGIALGLFRSSRISDTSDATWCNNRPDGLYMKEPCSSMYYTCHNGQAATMRCSKGLIFNAEKLQCDFKENAANCKEPFDCTSRKDGVYGDGCSSIFWYCSGGSVSLSRCPAGLFFDVKTLKCDYREHVEACGGETGGSPTTTMSTTVSTTEGEPLPVAPGVSVFAPASFSPGATDSETSHPFVATFPTYSPYTDSGTTLFPNQELQDTVDCRTLKNGNYATRKCSASFVMCADGMPVTQNCPAGLVFNPGSQQCETPGAECQIASTSSVSEPLHPVSGFQPPLPMDSTGYADNCANKPDGDYSNGCTTNFITCSNGEMRKRECVAGLVFDNLKKRCVSPIECLPMGPVASPSESSAGRHPESRVFDCLQLPDGTYGTRCSRTFTQCANGLMYSLNCPLGVLFDPAGKTCSLSVEQCRQSTGVPPPTNVYSPPVSAKKDCSSLPDGLYGDTCASSFVFCANGVSYPSNCPAGLVFYPSEKRCNRPLGHCQPPEHAVQSSPLSTVAQHSSGHFDCSALPDGLYGDNCAQAFLFCANGMLYPADCPAGLVFIPGEKRCGLPTRDCPSAAFAQTSTPRLPPSPAYTPAGVYPPRKHLDCSLLPDGLYGDACSPSFVKCSNGIAVPFTCYAGLVFNPITSDCEHPSWECHISTVGEDFSTWSRHRLSYASTVQAKAVDCLSLPDGDFSLGCSNEYFTCSNGRTLPRVCPYGQVFENHIKRCVRPEECGRTSVPTPAFSPVSSSQASPMISTAGAVDCLSVPDGDYSVGCSNEYFTCSNGRTVPRVCPYGQVFDNNRKRCVRPEECAGGGAVGPESNTQIPAFSSAGSPQVSPVFSAGAAVDCLSLPDGDFSLGCSNEYFTCSNGRTVPRTCYHGLVFDNGMKRCVRPEECAGGNFVVPEPAFSPVEPSQMPPMISAAGVVDCLSLPDGDFSLGCSNEFFTCSNGRTVPRTCHYGLVFDNGLKRCVRPDECTGGSTFVSESVVQTPVFSPAASSQASAVVSAAGAIDCLTLPDGDFSLGCSNEYVTCSNGRTVPRTCPHEQVFDNGLKRCVRLEECTIASSAGPESNAQSPAFSPLESSQAPVMVSAGSFDCSSLPDGHYSDGCTAYYVVCANGRTFTLPCPSGLVFDNVAKRCTWPESCSDTATIQTTAFNTAVPQSFQFPEGSFDCTSLSDGEYSNGCTPYYFVCSNGRSFTHPCPSGLVFDSVAKKCTWPENCLSPATTHPIQTFDATYPQPSQPSEGSFDCSSLPDGEYSNGCVAQYVVCSNGQTFLRRCDSILVFDNALKRCVWPENCGSTSAAQATTFDTQGTPAGFTEVPQSYHYFEGAVDCRELPDGDFSLGCSHKYFTCSNGRTLPRWCPHGQVFDSRLKRCVKPEECAAASTLGPGSTAPATPVFSSVESLQTVPVTAAGTQTSTSASAVAAETASPPSISVERYDCRNLPNGKYSSPCSSHFVLCSGGRSFTFYCPSTLVFDNVAGRCVWPHECGNAITEEGLVYPAEQQLSVTTVSSLSVTDSTESSSAEFDSQDVPTSGEFNCQFLPDGKYSSGCSSQFFVCASGKGFIQYCAADLVFDSVAGRCVSPEECDRQAKFQSTTTSAPVVVDIAPPASSPVERPLPSDGIDCSTSPDGHYSNDCAERFVTCWKGKHYENHCHPGFVFDNEVRHCVLRAKCPSSLVVSATGVPLAQAPSASYPGYFNCSLLPNGLYGTKCSSIYTVCSGGKSEIRSCPGGMVFNLSSYMCEFPVDCDSVAAEATTSSPTTQAYRPFYPVNPIVSFGGRFGQDAFAKRSPVFLSNIFIEGHDAFNARPRPGPSSFLPPGAPIPNVISPFDGFRRPVPFVSDSFNTPFLRSGHYPHAVYAPGPVIDLFAPPPCFQPPCHRRRVHPAVGLMPPESSGFISKPPKQLTTPASNTTVKLTEEWPTSTTAASTNSSVEAAVVASVPKTPSGFPPLELNNNSSDQVGTASGISPSSKTSSASESRRSGVMPSGNSVEASNATENSYENHSVQQNSYFTTSSAIVSSEAWRSGMMLSENSSETNNTSESSYMNYPLQQNGYSTMSSTTVPSESHENRMIFSGSPFEANATTESSYEDRFQHQSGYFMPFSATVASEIWNNGMVSSTGSSEANGAIENSYENFSVHQNIYSSTPYPTVSSESQESDMLPSGNPFEANATAESSYEDFFLHKRVHSMPSSATSKIWDNGVLPSTGSSEANGAKGNPYENHFLHQNGYATAPSTTVSSESQKSGMFLPRRSEVNSSEYEDHFLHRDHSKTSKDSAEAWSSGRGSEEVQKVIQKGGFSFDSPIPPMTTVSGRLLKSNGSSVANSPEYSFAKASPTESSNTNDKPEMSYLQHDYDPVVNRAGYTFEKPRPRRSISNLMNVRSPNLPSDEKCSKSVNGVMAEDCAARYIVCTDGKSNIFECPSGLVYDKRTNVCNFKSVVPECAKPRSSQLSPLVSPHADSVLPGFAPTRTALSEDPRCTFSETTALALGFCRNDFLLCLHDKIGYTSYCLHGYLFDHVNHRCVPSNECGVNGGGASVEKQRSDLVDTVNPMCHGVAEGELKEVGPCRNIYVICQKGFPVQRRCSGRHQTFSMKTKTCVDKTSNPECSVTMWNNRSPNFFTTPGSRHPFCALKNDGMYQHPSNCSKAIQCFFEDAFEYDMCENGLAFNELTGKCDYPSNVPGCGAESEKKMDCRGKSHGEFLPHESDCSMYYRCVWGHLEKMHCPAGMVFNPLFSVCDYSSEAPPCASSTH